VPVTRLPVTRCQICHRTVACRPGKGSDVPAERYRRARCRPVSWGLLVALRHSL